MFNKYRCNYLKVELKGFEGYLRGGIGCNINNLQHPVSLAAPGASLQIVGFRKERQALGGLEYSREWGSILKAVVIGSLGTIRL